MRPHMFLVLFCLLFSHDLIIGSLSPLDDREIENCSVYKTGLVLHTGNKKQKLILEGNLLKPEAVRYMPFFLHKQNSPTSVDEGKSPMDIEKKPTITTINVGIKKKKIERSAYNPCEKQSEIVRRFLNKNSW